ncbi:MAG: substrate-binding domain-containing protein [Lachnospiraceae bacterium]|nr:substrate-binding domain-containing protein [Lachnospiraceae bacterium]
MKKLITCLLTATLLVTTATGCSGNGLSAGSATSGKILYIVTDLNDTFRATLSEEIQAQASAQGVTLDMVETGNSVEEQAAQVAQAKSAGYSAIILRLSDASTALQMNVASNGLPIIYVNNQPDDEHLSADEFIFVGSDEEQAGQYQAEYVLNKLGNPASMDVIIFEGEEGHSGTIGRTDSVKENLKESGCDVNYVFVDYANWSDTEAQAKFDIFMKTGQNVDAIFCNNDTMALGVIEGMKEHGLDYSKIPVCGVDATSDGCASIEAGEMSFTVLQNAEGQASAAVHAASVLASGDSIKSVENATEDCKYIFVPFESVDSSNVSQYK